MILLVVITMLLIMISFYGFMLVFSYHLYFYEKTVKKLTDIEKDNYHKENMVSAKLVLIDIEKMPKTTLILKNG